MVRYAMKKIPKSITVTVRVTQRGTCMLLTGEWKHTDEDTANFKRVFNSVPPVGYHRITYTEDKRGAYKVVDYDGRALSRVRNSRGDEICACFIPEDWHGLRVSRKVEKL